MKWKVTVQDHGVFFLEADTFLEAANLIPVQNWNIDHQFVTAVELTNPKPRRDPLGDLSKE